MTIFLDGELAGLWRPVEGRVEVLELFGERTASERAALAERIERTETLLMS